MLPQRPTTTSLLLALVLKGLRGELIQGAKPGEN